MTGPTNMGNAPANRHYLEAERLLGLSTQGNPTIPDPVYALWVASAQAHALLAIAAVIRDLT